MSVKVLYFARLREALDTGSEELELAPGVQRVGELVHRLRARGEPWGEEFSGRRQVMVAVNQELVDMQSPLQDGDEVAFFPPVTGG
ncbi:MAG: molybdopterin converting factor subunit 1 [Gammaproteobacteria bacterium]|jgi:molybdopterin synthase sulfur carrier subunit